jgi:hypothetical protein
MKKIFNFPLQIVMNNPIYAVSCPSIKCSIWAIIWNLWQRGFHKVLTDADMKRLGNVSNTNWIEHGDDIKEIIAEIWLDLSAAHNRADKNYRKNLDNMIKGRETARINARKRKKVIQEQIGLSDEEKGNCELSTRNFSTVTEYGSNWHEGMHDKTKRQEIIAQRKIKTPSTGFTEK